jgi:hypothetical protein
MSCEEQSAGQSSAGQPKVWLWIFATVLGVGMLQWLGGTPEHQKKPGPTRGDLVLTEDALPAGLAGWTRTRFIPAPPVDELPKGQYWWVHQWQYQKGGATAVVSLDQLGLEQWHELTYCYRVLEWTIDHRSIQSQEASEGKYVVARMSKDDGQQGLLVFSVFVEDGQWQLPPDVELSLVNTWTEWEGVFGRLQGRVQQPEIPGGGAIARTSGTRRALQCQVFMTSPDPISDSRVASVIELHLRSRSDFRSHWLATQDAQKPQNGRE